MGTLILVLFHIVIVTVVFISAYRTGYRTCQQESRRNVEAYTAPLTKVLEQLNLDIDKILDDEKDR